MANEKDNLQARMVSWVSGRAKSGASGTALVLESIERIGLNGDSTILARGAAINEASTAHNIRRIMAAFDLSIKKDKKQPSGLLVVKPDGWKLENYGSAMDRLRKAVDEKLSIAGSKIGTAEFFMTDKEREAADRRAAEKAAEAEAEKAAEATPDTTPEVEPVEEISEDAAIEEIEQLFAQISTEAMQPLLNRLAAVMQAAMAAEIDATIAAAA